MTDEQRYTMENLRCQGFGYKKIAAETGVTENTVKSYFRRLKERGEEPRIRSVPLSIAAADIPEEMETTDISKKTEPFEKPASPVLADAPAKTDQPSTNVVTKECLFCGKPVKQTPGRREKKYCSDTCRGLWWNRNRYKVPRRSSKIFICKSCGAEFIANGAGDRKYCSHACYIYARFHKTLEGGIA